MENLLEKFLPSLTLFLMSCVGSGIVTLITLKFAYKKQGEDIQSMKVSVKEDSRILHDRITKKDVEHSSDLREIRTDIKQMLINQATINGFIDGLKSNNSGRRRS